METVASYLRQALSAARTSPLSALHCSSSKPALVPSRLYLCQSPHSQPTFLFIHKESRGPKMGTPSSSRYPSCTLQHHACPSFLPPEAWTSPLMRRTSLGSGAQLRPHPWAWTSLSSSPSSLSPAAHFPPAPPIIMETPSVLPSCLTTPSVPPRPLLPTPEAPQHQNPSHFSPTCLSSSAPHLGKGPQDPTNSTARGILYPSLPRAHVPAPTESPPGSSSVSSESITMLLQCARLLPCKCSAHYSFGYLLNTHFLESSSCAALT